MYRNLVVGLNVTVNVLLLFGVAQFCGLHVRFLRILIASLTGGAYCFFCLLPGFGFLANPWWRLVCLGLMAGIGFGLQWATLHTGAVFVLLSLALGGLAVGTDKADWRSVLSAVVILLLCCFSGKTGMQKYVPVELVYGQKKIQLTALRDTGNTLRDPVSGAPVLVVGAQIARDLTGLTLQQLKSPVESVGAIPGLRLIPYRTVGQSGGMLLAIRLPKVRIGSWQGSRVVAFAPEGLGEGGRYQALTGGAA